MKLFEREIASATTDCPNEWVHGCEPCDECGQEHHRYALEPYCDDCGRPHPEWFAQIKPMTTSK